MLVSQKWDGVLPDVKAVSAAMAKGEKPDVPYTLDDMAADAAALLDELVSAHALRRFDGRHDCAAVNSITRKRHAR